MPVDPELRLLDTHAIAARQDERAPRYVRTAARAILEALHGQGWRHHLAASRVRARLDEPPAQGRHLLRRALEIALAEGLPTGTRNRAIRCVAAAMIGVPPGPELAPLIAEALELGELPGVRVEALRERAHAWGQMRGEVGRMIREALEGERARAFGEVRMGV